MRPVAQQTARLFLALAILLIGTKRASPGTLRESLAGKKLPVDGARLANLDKKITSRAELDDANQFVIAYYVDDGTKHLNPPLFIDHYDRKGKEWSSVALPDAQSKSADMDVPCLGSVLRIAAVGARLVLDTHTSPSAGCMLILSPEMKLEATLYGWLLGHLGTDMLIYHRSEIHFAPVHPAEIALYDLRTRRDVTIFPPKQPTPVRQERIAQLREFYKPNEEWCNKNNDPCDPETFDSSLQGEIVTNEAESAVAFLISYEEIQYPRAEVQKPSGPKDVLYVYRYMDNPAKMQVREMPLSEEKARFGDVSFHDLLQPETLQTVFSETAPKKP